MRDIDEPDFGAILKLTPWWLAPASWLLLCLGSAAIAVAAGSSFPVDAFGIGVVRLGVPSDAPIVSLCSIDGLRAAAAPAPPPRSDTESGAMYMALLDGNSRPRLAPGMHVTLRVPGYPEALNAKLEAVSDRPLPAGEVRSILESLGADTSALGGPVACICGRLPSDRIGGGGDDLRLHDGMLAEARVRLGEERPLDRLRRRAR